MPRNRAVLDRLTFLDFPQIRSDKPATEATHAVREVSKLPARVPLLRMAAGHHTPTAACAT